MYELLAILGDMCRLDFFDVSDIRGTSSTSVSLLIDVLVACQVISCFSRKQMNAQWHFAAFADAICELYGKLDMFV